MEEEEQFSPRPLLRSSTTSILSKPESERPHPRPLIQLTLCRHGESDGNALQLCQGASQGFLTELGKQQAHALGVQLFASFESEEFDETWCSDLYRVQETCAIAHEAGGNLKDYSNVIYSSLLREKCSGAFEGRPRSEYYAAHSASGMGRDFRPEHGESWNDVQIRIETFIEMILQNLEREREIGRVDRADEPKRILVFTSGGVMKEFINAFVYQRTDDRENEYPNCAGNCSTFMFNIFSANLVEMVLENKKISPANFSKGSIGSVLSRGVAVKRSNSTILS